jgi:hypothetical protein
MILKFSNRWMLQWKLMIQCKLLDNNALKINMENEYIL